MMFVSVTARCAVAKKPLNDESRRVETPAYGVMIQTVPAKPLKHALVLVPFDKLIARVPYRVGKVKPDEKCQGENQQPGQDK